MLLVEFVGLSHSVLCSRCVCVWSLPPRALEHRWYSHYHWMLWKHDLAALLSSLWASTWAFFRKVACFLVVSWRCCFFWCSKRGFHFCSCLLFSKVLQLVPWSNWQLILTQGDLPLSVHAGFFVRFLLELTLIIAFQHPRHCVCRNCDSLYLFLRGSDVGKTQRVPLPRRTAFVWLVNANVASVCLFHLWWLCIHL